ncbi:MAG: hypothetical protein ACXVDW_15940 [Bacteroidia bacterium]
MVHQRLIITIAIAFFTQACSTSQSKTDENKIALVDTSYIAAQPKVAVLDNDFEKYLSKYYYSAKIPVSTQSLLKEIYAKIPPPFKKDSNPLTDFRLKPFTLQEIEKYIGPEEMKEVKGKNVESKDNLNFYPSYILVTNKKEIITCLIARSSLEETEALGGLLLITYDLKGNIITKKMIDIASERSVKIGNFYQTAIILEDSINTKKATYFKDSTIRTTENYSFEKNGTLKLINKQEHGKKWDEGDSKWLGLYDEN